MRRSASKSPARDAAMKASTISRWRASGTSDDVGPAPRTRRRARLASWRVAVGVRSTIGAISSNGSPNVSWRTNARRSAGGSRSRTMSIAKPIESARTVRRSGSGAAESAPPSMLETIGSGSWTPISSSRRAGARPQPIEAEPGDDRREPAAQVLDLGDIGSTRPEPGVLDGVLRLGQRAEHPIRHGSQMRAMFLEASGEPVGVGHAVTFSGERPSID